MNPKLQARVAHVVDGKAANWRPTYYKLVKFAVQKEAEINFDKAKKTRDLASKPKAITHFSINPRNLGCLPLQQFGWLLQPMKKNLVRERPPPLPSEESDSGESYEA